MFTLTDSTNFWQSDKWFGVSRVLLLGRYETIKGVIAPVASIVNIASRIEFELLNLHRRNAAWSEQNRMTNIKVAEGRRREIDPIALQLFLSFALSVTHKSLFNNNNNQGTEK